MSATLTVEEEWFQNMIAAWRKPADVGATHFGLCELSHKDCAIRELMKGMEQLFVERRQLLQQMEHLQKVANRLIETDKRLKERGIELWQD